jgi:hypothetical protein
MSANPASRVTAQPSEPFVVFLIGMRVNKFSAVRKWWPVASAFPRMIQQLQKEPELGMLGSELFYSLVPLTTICLSYWKSFDHLERFARGKGGLHVEAWQRFMKDIGYTNGVVGIYHETYLIEPGKSESIYGNMPPFGLSKAFPGTVVGVGERLSRARTRIGTGKHADEPLPESA